MQRGKGESGGAAPPPPQGQLCDAPTREEPWEKKTHDGYYGESRSFITLRQNEDEQGHLSFYFLLVLMGLPFSGDRARPPLSDQRAPP